MLSYALVFANLLVVFGANTANAHPHAGIGSDSHEHKALGLEIAVGEAGVTYDILISNGSLNQLIPRERGNLKLELRDNAFDFLDPTQKEGEYNAIRAFLRDNIPAIVIDGATVEPAFESMAFLPAIDPTGITDHAKSPPDARAVVHFPSSKTPRTLTLRWSLFAEQLNRDAFGRPKPIELAARLDAGAQSKIITFTQSQDEYIWDAGDDDGTLGVAPVRVVMSNATMKLPLLSAGLIFLGLVVLLTARFAGAARRTRTVLLLSMVIPLAGAIALRGVWTTRVELPWQTAQPITQSEAEQVLTELLRNVYRAFDYREESDVYDVLAASVDGDQLDDIYAEVYASLVAREQGGAVARVKDLEFVTVELDAPDAEETSEDQTFSAKCRWRVYGLVYHWGHVHDRANEYRARYTISARDGVWKITGTERIGQKRLARLNQRIDLPRNADQRFPGGGPA